MKIIIINYDSGNIKSIDNMLRFLGISAEITDDPKKIVSADKIIFPGQGHFSQAVNNLEKKRLIPTIKEVLQKETPFLGICLGLQILFEESEEALNVKGLGILKGKVKKFKDIKTPQVGWNKIITTKQNSMLKDDFFYFVNSYYVEPDDKNIISATANYGKNFCASIESKNLIATQFHPEKSAESGILFFENWIKS